MDTASVSVVWSNSPVDTMWPSTANPPLPGSSRK